MESYKGVIVAGITEYCGDYRNGLSMVKIALIHSSIWVAQMIRSILAQVILFQALLAGNISSA